NIATEIGAQRRVQIATSQGRLLDLLRVGGGGTTQAQSIIQGINSLQDAQRLRGLLNTPDTPIATTKGDEMVAALDELIQALRVLEVTEKEQTRASEETNRLQLEELRLFKTHAGARM